MSCLLTAGYALGCKDNTGGIKYFLVSNFSGATTYAYGSLGEITGGTSTPTTWYKVEQRNEVGDFTQAGQHNVANGTNYWDQTAIMTLYKYQASIRNLLYTMAQTRLSVIAVDQNGNAFLLGETNGADLTASTGSAGKAYGDLNGSIVTVLAKEPSPARQISATYFGTLSVTP